MRPSSWTGKTPVKVEKKDSRVKNQGVHGPSRLPRNAGRCGAKPPRVGAATGALEPSPRRFDRFDRFEANLDRAPSQ
jgi:hypothetical protein